MEDKKKKKKQQQLISPVKRKKNKPKHTRTQFPSEKLFYWTTALTWRKVSGAGRSFVMPTGREEGARWGCPSAGGHKVVGGYISPPISHPHCCWAPIMPSCPSPRQGAADVPRRSSPPAVLVPAEALPLVAPSQAEIFSRLRSPCLARPHLAGGRDHSPHLSFSFSVVLPDRGVGDVFADTKIYYISLVYLKFLVLS